MNPALELLRSGVEFAQNVGSTNLALIFAAYIGVGWLTPALPHRGDSRVIERYNKLHGLISHAKELGHKPKTSNIIKLTILNLTRGAFIHSNIHGARMESERQKLKKEQGR